MTSRVGVYLRISDKDQNIEGQRAEMETWLARNNITDAAWYVDIQTGKNLKRPDFQRLEQDIRRGKITTVATWKLDRLARNMKDGINVISDWLDRDVRIVAITQAFDWSGSLGKMVAGILFAFAEMERSMLRERQAAGIAVAKTKGKYTGRKAGTLKAKPERARELKARGFNEREIAAALKVSERTVYRYLGK